MTALEQNDYPEDSQPLLKEQKEQSSLLSEDENTAKTQVEETLSLHSPKKNTKQNEESQENQENQENQEPLNKEDFSSLREWFSYLAKVEEALSTNPKKVLSELARAYGVSSFSQGECSLAAKQDAYRQKAAEAYAQRMRSLQRYRQANDILDSFMSKCDERGDSCCPYFQNVRKNMADLLEKGLAENLEEAYEKASWLNEQTRKELLRHETDKALKQKAQEVRKAKEAALFIKGGAENDVDFNNLSTREMLELQFQNINDF